MKCPSGLLHAPSFFIPRSYLHRQAGKRRQACGHCVYALCWACLMPHGSRQPETALRMQAQHIQLASSPRWRATPSVLPPLACHTARFPARCQTGTLCAACPRNPTPHRLHTPTLGTEQQRQHRTPCCAAQRTRRRARQLLLRRRRMYTMLKAVREAAKHPLQRSERLLGAVRGHRHGLGG